MFTSVQTLPQDLKYLAFVEFEYAISQKTNDYLLIWICDLTKDKYLFARLHSLGHILWPLTYTWGPHIIMDSTYIYRRRPHIYTRVFYRRRPHMYTRDCGCTQTYIYSRQVTYSDRNKGLFVFSFSLYSEKSCYYRPSSWHPQPSLPLCSTLFSSCIVVFVGFEVRWIVS